MGRKPANTNRTPPNQVNMICVWDGDTRLVTIEPTDMNNKWVRSATVELAGKTITGKATKFALEPDKDFWFEPDSKWNEYILATMKKMKVSPAKQKKFKRRAA